MRGRPLPRLGRKLVLVAHFAGRGSLMAHGGILEFPGLIGLGVMQLLQELQGGRFALGKTITR